MSLLPKNEYQREVQTGFDIVCKGIAVGFDWFFYIILFPICYPMAILGRRQRARDKREHEEYLAKHARPATSSQPASMAEIMAAARRK